MTMFWLMLPVWLVILAFTAVWAIRYHQARLRLNLYAATHGIARRRFESNKSFRYRIVQKIHGLPRAGTLDSIRAGGDRPIGVSWSQITGAPTHIPEDP
jgi:hypothetical protein